MHRIVIPVVRRPDYVLELEQFDDMAFIHCQVARWTHRVKGALADDFATLFGLHGGPLFVVGTDDPKLPKFLSLFGFRPDGTCKDIDRTDRTLYRKD